MGEVSQPSPPISTNAEREILPKSLKPVHYDLRFEPHMDEAIQYDGSVEIEIDVLEDASSITLNASDIKFLETEVMIEHGKTVGVLGLVFDEPKERVIIQLKEKVLAGSKVYLKQAFQGSMLHPSLGFFRAPYKTSDGSQKWMAVTQMEPTYARKVFPCFDEPALKATFSVTLVVDKHLTALGNMDVASEMDIVSKGKEKKRVLFNETPPMSTYIVCFAVGELQMIETNAFRVPVRVYAAIDKNIEHGRLALNLAPRILSTFEKIFDIDYPLPKLDLIAVPGAPGAMENWGLITFVESFPLVDEAETSAEAYRFAGSVLVHEIAHQWFGNLVTMSFWEGLWLNESFADWAELCAWETLQPEWQMWQNYAAGGYQEGLQLDANKKSHPIEVVVNKASEINQIFDEISYCKGCAVIRMISGLLGAETFVQGVRLYLKKHAYGNAQTSDLWVALSHTSGKDVESLMESWTKHVGYPVVEVEEKEEGLILTQHRFLQDGSLDPEGDEVLYSLSLQLRTSDGIDGDIVLHDRTITVKVPQFFKLNADQTGFYRVAYSPGRLQILSQNAKDGLISVNDRIGIVSDALTMAQSGRSKTSTVLSLVKAFREEGNFFVWKQLFATLNAIIQAWTFEDEAVYKSLKIFKSQLGNDCLKKKGWNFTTEDDLIEQMFKAILFSNSGDDEGVQKAAAGMFAAFIDGDDKAININLRKAVFSITLEHGSEREASSSPVI